MGEMSAVRDSVSTHALNTLQHIKKSIELIWIHTKKIVYIALKMTIHIFMDTFLTELDIKKKIWYNCQGDNSPQETKMTQKLTQRPFFH